MTDDELAAYSAALDEIWRLRRALAYEARVVEAQTLDLSRLGKNRRDQIERAIERMKSSARGATAATYAHVNTRAMGRCMEEAGAEDALTRFAWEASLAQRGTRPETRELTMTPVERPGIPGNCIEDR